MQKPLLTFLLLLAFLRTYAQETEMQSDRIGYSISAVSLKPRTFQLEAGASFAESIILKELIAPTITLRYGLVNNIELRMSYNSNMISYKWPGFSGYESSGLNLTGGMKISFLKSEKRDIAVAASFGLQYGMPALQFNACYSRKFQNGFYINYGVNSLSGRPLLATTGITIKPVIPITKKTQLFTEATIKIQHIRGFGPFDRIGRLGIIAQPAKSLMFDLSCGIGVGGNTGFFRMIDTGVSWAF